jgi:hypothetical protein
MLDVLSNWNISPYPSIIVAQAIHITARYFPVRVTIIPEKADIAAAPSEYGSILNHVNGKGRTKYNGADLTPAPVAEEPRAWKYKGR